MLSLLLAALFVQANPAPGVEEIVVTAPGRAASAKVLRTVMRSIARPADTGDGDFQMARWIEPVCPVVIGIDADAATTLDAAIRRIAADAGAPVGGRLCARNIEVVVTSNPRDSLLEAQSREPGFLRGIPRRDVAAMIDSTAAVRWGSVTLTYSADGRPMEPGGVVRSEGASRLRAGTQTGLGRMIVIVDRDQVASMPVDSWQSCVALVALAQFRPNTASGGPDSVLAVADGAPSSINGLTSFDRAYLKALYASGANLHGSAQQLYMTRRVASLIATDLRR